MLRAFAVRFTLLVAAMAPAVSAEFTGRATIIDGDTIEVAGQRIRLYGIDAPEGDQTCVARALWRCGQEAAFALARIIETHWVHCAEKDRDQYERVVAVCHLSGPNGPELNAQMVREGWALAYRHYSTDYVSLEEEAKSAHRGVWRGTLQAPWDWRVAQQAKERAATSQRLTPQPSASSGGCNIKGNISTKGERIYHVPGGEFYRATQINPAKGERWFCSEAEALAAGWRRSRR